MRLAHQGSRPDSGHCVSIAKHQGRFYLYNDARVSEIREGTLRCRMLLGGSEEPFFASAVLYEECVEDIGNFSAPACGGTIDGRNKREIKF